MISLALNAIDRFILGNNDKLSLQNQELSEALSCNIVEIMEMDSAEVPNYPLDSGEFISDTIYTLPKTISVRVFVYSDDIVFFERDLENIQKSNDLFKITSLYAKNYENLKYLTYSSVTNSSCLGGRQYNLEFKQIKLVSAFVENISNYSNASYTGKSNLGAMQSTEQNKSALLKGVELFTD